MQQTTNIEQIVKSSFLSRVPEIMSRGGFTLETAMEQAFKEDEALCLELHNGTTERAQVVCRELSDRVYTRIRAANPNPKRAFQSRYVDWATSNGNTPEEQLAADKASGSFVGYITWNSKKH